MLRAPHGNRQTPTQGLFSLDGFLPRGPPPCKIFLHDSAAAVVGGKGAARQGQDGSSPTVAVAAFAVPLQAGRHGRRARDVVALARDVVRPISESRIWTKAEMLPCCCLRGLMPFSAVLCAECDECSGSGPTLRAWPIRRFHVRVGAGPKKKQLYS